MMSEAVEEEVSVLSSIYCGDGEFTLVQRSSEDGLVVLINSTVGGEGGPTVSLLFGLHPRYPSNPPDISVSSTSNSLSRSQCNNIRQRLLDQASVLPPEPMVHQLVQWLQQQQQHQFVEVTEPCRGEEVLEEKQWAAILLLDHMRSQNRYTGLLERWSQQLQLTVRLLLGRTILIILLGVRPSIKEFCRLLKTVKVDVDSSGKKCKERMMKVLIETPLSSTSGHDLQGFVMKSYKMLPELEEVFQEMNMVELYKQILPLIHD